MSEILETVTQHSLVLVDELGMVCNEDIGSRICNYVLHRLGTIGCLTFFLTHYNSMVIEDRLSLDVKQWTMGSVPYRFKLGRPEHSNVRGSESKNVLRLVGLPESMITMI